MADISSYISGKVVTDAKRAHFFLKFLKIPLFGTFIKKYLLFRIQEFSPLLVTIDTAVSFIQKSQKCAIGNRMCMILDDNPIKSQTVFLDELADGLCKAGKAQYVSKNEAIKIIKKTSKKTLLLSKISGKYLEICNYSPKECIYWNMEKCGLKCINNNF